MANTAPLIGGASTYANSFQPVSFTRASTSNGSSNGLLGAVLNFAGGFLDRRQERKLAQQQMEWNEAMMDKQNEWSLDMWNKTNEYNAPSSQLARLREAGLNPLYYGLDGTSANGLESAQPLGYDRASMRGLANPLASGLEGYMSMKSMQKDIDLKNAQIDKIKADTSSTELDNEWKDKTMDARVEAEGLRNSLTKEQVETFKKEREKMDKEINKLIEEAKTEIEKRAYVTAQKILADKQAQEIVTLLPYKKLLTEAQTQAQKAAAAASFAKASIDRHMLDSGYYDSIVEQAAEAAKKAGFDTETAQFQRDLEAYKSSLKNGTAFSRARELDGKESNAMSYVLDKTIQVLSIVGDTATAPIVGLLGGRAAGNALSKSSKKGFDNPLAGGSSFGTSQRTY